MSFTQKFGTQKGADLAALPPVTAAAARRWIHDHWRLFLAEGVVLLLLGVVAMLVPPLAGLTSTIFLGWLLAVVGIVGLFTSLRARSVPGFSWSLVSAIVALLAGIVLIVNPWAAMLTLTLVLAAYFLVDGVIVIATALTHRREASDRWEWMLLNGVVDLVLAAIIISGMPNDLTWVLGLLVGIDLIFGGASLIAMALASRTEAA
jgi:uncharacterized membrane protein HdeD (DUF308 family)